MKSKKSSLTAVLFAALIGTAFMFTACWQGTPAGGSGIPEGGGGGSGGGVNKTESWTLRDSKKVTMGKPYSLLTLA